MRSAVRAHKAATNAASCEKFEESHNRCIRMNSIVGSIITRTQGGPIGEAAEQHARAAVAMAVEEENMPPLHLLSAQRNLMLVLVQRQREAEAIEVGHEALEGFKAVVGQVHPATVSLLRELSVIALDIASRTQEWMIADELVHEAEANCRSLFGKIHPESLSAGMLLGQLLASQGNLGRAKTVMQQNLRTSRLLHGDSQITLLASSNLAAMLMELNEYDSAEALLTWHMRVVQREHGVGSDESLAVARRLAECKAAAGDQSCARELRHGCAGCEKLQQCAGVA